MAEYAIETTGLGRRFGRIEALTNVSLTVPTGELVGLIDSYAASAGEDFVKYVRQLKNVVLVGTNTCGAMLAGNVGLFTLPNAKIGLSCGTKISLCEDLVNPDGRGLMPDLWVHPDEALERAIKYIQAVQADGRNH